MPAEIFQPRFHYPPLKEAQKADAFDTASSHWQAHIQRDMLTQLRSWFPLVLGKRSETAVGIERDITAINAFLRKTNRALPDHLQGDKADHRKR